MRSEKRNIKSMCEDGLITSNLRIWRNFLSKRISGRGEESERSIGNNGRKLKRNTESWKNSEWMKTLFNGTQICARAFGTVAIIDWYSLLWIMKNSVNGDIQHSQSFTWNDVKTKEPPYTERYVRWCGRSVDKIIIYLLPDCNNSENNNLQKVNRHFAVGLGRNILQRWLCSIHKDV